jgi:hypothetical protein
MAQSAPMEGLGVNADKPARARQSVEVESWPRRARAGVSWPRVAWVGTPLSGGTQHRSQRYLQQESRVGLSGRPQNWTRSWSPTCREGRGGGCQERQSGKGEVGLIKDDVSRDEHAVRGEIEAPVPLMLIGVAKEDTDWIGKKAYVE